VRDNIHITLSRYRTRENTSSVKDPPSAVRFVKVNGGVIEDSKPLDDKGRVRKGLDFLVSECPYIVPRLSNEYYVPFNGVNIRLIVHPVNDCQFKSKSLQVILHCIKN
jgi:hypothetical protein